MPSPIVAKLAKWNADHWSMPTKPLAAKTYERAAADIIAHIEAAGLRVIDPSDDSRAPVTEDYRLAIGGEGPQAYQWEDKPHRLVYDLCSEVDRLRALLEIKSENL